MKAEIDKGKRLKELRINKNLSLEEIGKMIGASKQTVFKYENNIITNIPSDKIESLSKIYGVSPAYLMGWEEYLEYDQNKAELNKNYDLLSDEGKHTLVYYSDSLLKNENEQVKEDTELYSVEVTESVAAGLGYRYGNNETTRYYTDRSDLKDYDYATLVRGDSMEPAYNDGDIILVKAGYDNSNGEVYVIDYDGKSYVKKLYNDGDRFRLVSINRDYDNIIIDLPIKEVYFNIVGKVVDCFTPLKK